MVGLVLVIVVSSLVGCWFGLCLTCLLGLDVVLFWYFGWRFVVLFWLVAWYCGCLRLFTGTCSLPLFCFGCLVV